MDAHDAGRIARSLETLHALSYFAPEVEAEVTALGVRRGRATYTHAVAPWGALGAAGADRLAELGRPLVATALARGAFPDGVFAVRR